MKALLFASDLDNTLLYAKKRLPQGMEGLCVEYLEGSPQGFFTGRTVQLLKEVAARAFFVPVTTRSLEQYRRIRWPEGCAPEMALVANGAVLLRHGEEDGDWKRETGILSAPWEEELFRLRDTLSRSSLFDLCRIVDGAYLFARCRDAATAREQAEGCRGMTGLAVHALERKIYFLPPGLSKGDALRRLRKRLLPAFVIAAGDSAMDLPMLREADLALVPGENLSEGLREGKARFPRGGEWFSDWLLEQALAHERFPASPSAANSKYLAGSLV